MIKYENDLPYMLFIILFFISQLKLEWKMKMLLLIGIRNY